MPAPYFFPYSFGNFPTGFSIISLLLRGWIVISGAKRDELNNTNYTILFNNKNNFFKQKQLN